MDKLQELLPLVWGCLVALAGLLAMIWRACKADQRMGPHYCRRHDRYCDKSPSECERNDQCHYWP